MDQYFRLMAQYLRLTCEISLEVLSLKITEGNKSIRHCRNKQQSKTTYYRLNYIHNYRLSYRPNYSLQTKQQTTDGTTDYGLNN